MSRGWEREDTISNTSYYLYIGVWYRSISPSSCITNFVAYINHVSDSGYIHATIANIADGGVQTSQKVILMY